MVRNTNPLHPQNSTEVASFLQLPLTQKTIRGLDKAHFKKLTEIQRKVLPFALKGRDILGAAKTGSGKTLAFIVPILEILHRQEWSPLDGLGALVISPTRELATQIFNVLRKVGQEHTFSAGLIIGGKNLQEEKQALNRMNIVVCTPGRMLQHMDQTTGLILENLQILVLDEADRILDMGFKKDLDAIFKNLPKQRQTLLFSATQTESTSDLARLNLRNPELVAVHEKSEYTTPKTLEQYYIVVPLPSKLDFLYSFIQNHKNNKILVFLSSCKQVRFVYETFRKLRPGVPLVHLHGRQKQATRADITGRFAAARESCMFATDVVARGLDFPGIEWVVQLDAPEDSDTYIHRVGRTARFGKNGRALLFLCPSEEAGMIARLNTKKVPIVRVNAKPDKQCIIKHKLQHILFKDAELKALGQKSFVSYIKSISVQKDHEIFKLNALPLEEYANALGLPGTPKIKRLSKVDSAKTNFLKNQSHGLKVLQNERTEGEKDIKMKDKKKGRSRYDRMVERRNDDVFAHHYSKLISHDSLEDELQSDKEFFKPTGRFNLSAEVELNSLADQKVNVNTTGIDQFVSDSKRRSKLAISKKGLTKTRPKGAKIVFDEEVGLRPVGDFTDEAGFHARGDVEVLRQSFLGQEQKAVATADIEDWALEKQKRQLKREKRWVYEPGTDKVDMVKNIQFPLYKDAPGFEGDINNRMKDWEFTGQKRVKLAGNLSEDHQVQGAAKKQKIKHHPISAHPGTLQDLEAFAKGLLL